MKNKEFIDLALIQMNKIYKIRKEIVPVKIMKLCNNAMQASSYYGRLKMTKNEMILAETGRAIFSFTEIRHRFNNWSSVGVSNNYDDSVVIREIKKFVLSLNTCINNQYTDYRLDPILEEVKENLESLIIIVELSI